MANNIELIKLLRERTGAGMMDCKHALDETNNDIDKATDWLREKGIAKQAKKVDRIAAEGLALIATCGCCGNACVTEVNCETDFVANSDPFKELVLKCSETALHNDCKSLEELKGLVAEDFNNAAIKLGEKLSIRRFNIVYKEDGYIGTYIHNKGKIAVIVKLKKEDEELANGLAMHIAANDPKYIVESNIPAEVYEKERLTQVEVCKNDPKLANKPEAALANIVKGKVHKVLSESVLADQEYLLEPGKTIGQVLSERGNEVVEFVRYSVGEGLEKRQDNFAEEVMSQVK